MNIHIMYADKFVFPYIDFINKNFDSSKHLFVIMNSNQDKDTQYQNYNNVMFLDKSIYNYLKILKLFYSSKKVFLHSLFNAQLIIMLFIQPWLLSKCFWLVWGGDLYSKKLANKSIKSILKEFIRKTIIKNMGGIITHIEGDYKLAQIWYGAKGKYYYSFLYPSNLYRYYDLGDLNKQNNVKYIQIGNSSDPSNEHIEIFEKLEKYKEKNIRIICPLSYGNKKYREKVIKKGNEIFGEKFHPIIDFLPFQGYLKVLAKIDVAIFNHKRQQAVGNITTLLGLGKKVYIRDDITTWDFCKSHSLYVYSINNPNPKILKTISSNISEENIKNVKKHFSEEKLKKDWKLIFDAKGR